MDNKQQRPAAIRATSAFAALAERILLGEVTHAELADMLLRGAGEEGVALPSRDALLADLRQAHPTQADLGRHMHAMLESYLAYAALTGGTARLDDDAPRPAQAGDA